MAESIKSSEIYEPKILADLINQLEHAQKSMKDLNVQTKATATSLKTVLQGTKITDSNSINQANASLKESERLTRLKIQTDRESVKLEQDLSRLRQVKAREDKANNVATAQGVNAYKQQSAVLTQLKNKYKDLAVQNKDNTREARNLLREITQLDRKLKQVDATVGNHQRSVGKYSNALNKLKGMASGLIGVFALFSGVRFFANAETKLVSLQLALKNVMKTQERYAQSFKFLTEMSRSYGQDLLVLTDTYKGFIASSQSSGLQLSELNRIYESVIKAGSSLALSNDQISGSLLAISQMFSKGTVSAEELRGQLGERLPGAFGLMAKAIGVTEAELGKMMKRGEVMAKDVLPLLATELENTYGAGAVNNLKTVGGAWNVLKTNLMLYVNEANESNGITQKIAKAIGFLANNLTEIGSVLVKLIKHLVIYKTSMIAISVAQKLFMNDLGKMNFSLKQVKENMNSGSDSAGRFKGALKSMGVALLIALFVELSLKIYDTVSGIEAMREKLDIFNKMRSENEKHSDLFLENLDKEIKKTDILIKAKLKNGQITEAQAKIEREDAELRRRVIIQTKMDIIRMKQAELKTEIAKPLEDDFFQDKNADKNLLLRADRIRGMKDALSILTAEYGRYKSTLLDLESSVPDSVPNAIGKADEIKSLAKEIEEAQNSQLSDNFDRKVQELTTANKFRKKEIMESVALETEKATLILELENILQMNLRELRAEFLLEQKNDYNERAKLSRETLDKIDQDEQEKWDKKFQRLTEDLDNVYEQTELRKIAEIQYEEDVRTLKILSTTQTEDEKRRLLKESHEQRLRDEISYLEKSKNETREDAKAIMDLKIELARSTGEKITQIDKETLKATAEVVKITADYFIQQSNRRIEALDREMAQHEKAYSLYSDLAKSGNINAKESLALENQQIVEANKKKAQEQKKQQRIRLAETAFTSYSANASNPEVKNPLTKTITDITLLTAFINTLPTFEVGTEDTGSNGSGIDGRGGFLAINHPNERIVSKGDNAMMGGVSNSKLASTMNDFNSGKLVQVGEGANQLGGAWNFTPLLDEIKELSQIMKNKPELDLQVGELIQGTIDVVTSKTSGNTRFTNKYRVE